jgi:RNA polymerase-binding protein DksA
MADLPLDELRRELLEKKTELAARLDRISANLQRGFNADSKEMAKELEDSEVVDALGNEARGEIVKITAALTRMDEGNFGLCTECGESIDTNRVLAYPYAEECIDCAKDGERRKGHA